ncbi:uncharacterized protein WCC33_003214 [Rhinophrynus dorsalis]
MVLPGIMSSVFNTSGSTKYGSFSPAIVVRGLSSHNTFRIKWFLAKKQKQNRPVPQWICMKTGNEIRYISKRSHWRRTKLGLYSSLVRVLWIQLRETWSTSLDKTFVNSYFMLFSLENKLICKK